MLRQNLEHETRNIFFSKLKNITAAKIEEKNSYLCTAFQVLKDMQQKDVFYRFQKFLSKTEGEFHILEHQVPIETQMEYFKNSNRLRSFMIPLKSALTADEEEYIRFVSELHDPETSETDKKQILSVLAVSKQIRAYRILEQYVQSPEKELADWAYMALMESRMTLESDLTDEKFIYISTGLGGKGKKLRFYILLLSTSGDPFLDYQQQVIEREFAYTLTQEDGEIEQFTIKNNYIEMFVLLPIHSDIKKIIKHVVHECNQYGNFISDAVTVTNVRKLTDDEIAKIIELRENKIFRTSP